MPITRIPFIPPTVSLFLHGIVEVNQDDESYIGSQDFINMQKMQKHQNILLLYPGVEEIVEELLQNGIPVSEDGEVEITDEQGIVVATADLLLKEYKLAINPVDETSRRNFMKYGYKTVSSEEFDIKMLKS